MRKIRDKVIYLYVILRLVSAYDFYSQVEYLLGLGRVASRLGHLRLRQEFSGSNLGQVIVLYK